MLRRKLPDEIFAGRRVLPASLFRRDDVASYLANLRWALNETVTELGAEESVDLFDLTRRLGHRMGLASAAGPGSAKGESFERLVSAFETLDGSAAFVHPDAMAAVAASDKRAERSALETVVGVIGQAVRRSDSGSARDATLFGRIIAAWQDAPNRIRGIGLDVALIHIASMSNLMAALGWAMVDLLEHPSERNAVTGGDHELAQRCALESTRLAQGSIMSRAVLTSVDLDTGTATYRLPAGWTVATLLPLLNSSVAPGLERWDSARWRRHRLAEQDELPSPSLVTAFGHGRHSCPAQPFSLAAMTSAMTHLLGTYRMTPRWTSLSPTGSRADRRGGAAVRSTLCPLTPPASRCFAARWPVRSSSEGCRVARVRRCHRRGTAAATRPEGGSTAPGTGTD